MEYTIVNGELYHHGIKGQKWGVRRYQNPDGSLTAAGKKQRAENYSEEQRIRDRKIYGKGAEKRINDRMLNGESIQSARHNEVVRKEKIEHAKTIGKTAAKGILTIGVATVGYNYLQKKGFNNFEAGLINGEVVNIGKHIINAMLR